MPNCIVCGKSSENWVCFYNTEYILCSQECTDRLDKILVSFEELKVVEELRACKKPSIQYPEIERDNDRFISESETVLVFYADEEHLPLYKDNVEAHIFENKTMANLVDYGFVVIICKTGGD